MFNKIAPRLAIFLLKHTSISIEDRNKLLTAIMDKLGAIPLHDIIVINDDKSLIINGQTVDLEAARIISRSAKVIRDEPIYKLIQDQITYKTFKYGIEVADNAEKLFVSKAALWWSQQLDELLSLLAGPNKIEE